MLGLLLVLALVALLPARALADRGSDLLSQPAAGSALASDAASGGESQTDPSPPLADPASLLSDPATPSDPAPPDPAPAPSEPAPDPAEPAPAPSDPPPSDPAPAPSDPAPAPSDPAPAPADPVPPADEVPADPEPAPSDPVPADPAPRDGRAATPKPPSSEERQVPLAEATPAPLTTLAPTPTAPSSSAEAAPPSRAQQPDAGDAARQAKVVRATFKRLGLGTIADSRTVEGRTLVPTGPAQACTPVGTVVVTEAPQVGATLATHAGGHPRRVDDDPPAARGPPAPLQPPSSPTAAVAGSSAGAGGVGGERDCAILADQIVFTLADGGCAVACDCCDHVAPAPSGAAARAPPVV